MKILQVGSSLTGWAGIERYVVLLSDGLAAKGGPVAGFEVAGADGKYSAADAKIEGTSVVASSTSVPAPVSVRYAWAANPTCNLVNREGLPASPFQAPE